MRAIETFGFGSAATRTVATRSAIVGGSVRPWEASRVRKCFPFRNNISPLEAPSAATVRSMFRPFTPPTIIDGDPRAQAAGGGGVAGLGALVFGCTEAGVAIERLGVALGQAEGLSVSSATLAAAQDFYSRHRYVDSAIFGNSCATLTNEANGHLTNVTQMLIAGNVTPVTVPGADIKAPPPGSENPLTDIKTIAIAAAVIIGAVVLAPVIFEAVGSFRSLRRGR